jgi:hypothetical protein
MTRRERLVEAALAAFVLGGIGYLVYAALVQLGFLPAP